MPPNAMLAEDFDSEPAYRALATLSFAVEKTRPAGSSKLPFGEIIANGQQSILEKKRRASLVLPRAHVNVNRLQAEDYLTFDLNDDDDDGEDDWKPLEASSPGSPRINCSPKSFNTDSHSYRALQQGTAVHAPRFHDLSSMSSATSSNPVIAAMKAKQRLMHDLDKPEPVPNIRVPSLSSPSCPLSPTSPLSQAPSSSADLLLDQLQAATSPHKPSPHMRRSSILGPPPPSLGPPSPGHSPTAASGPASTASAPLLRFRAGPAPPSRGGSCSNKDLELLATTEEEHGSAQQRGQRVRRTSLGLGPGYVQGRPSGRPPALFPALAEEGPGPSPGPGPGPRASQDARARRNSMVGLTGSLRISSTALGAPGDGVVSGSGLNPRLSLQNASFGPQSPQLSKLSDLSKLNSSPNSNSNSGQLIKAGVYEGLVPLREGEVEEGGWEVQHSHSGTLKFEGQQEVVGGVARRVSTVLQPGAAGLGGEGGESLRLPQVAAGRAGRQAGSGRSSPAVGGGGGGEGGRAETAHQRSEGLMTRLKMWVKGAEHQ